MATSKSLKTAVKKEAKQAESDARTGDVKTSSQVEAARKGDLGPWNEEQARLANSDKSLPTYTRRSVPPE